MKKKLYRDVQQGALSGVCAGLGTYFEIDKTWIRLAFVMSVIFASWLGLGMLGPIVYIILWIVVPAKPKAMPSTWYGDSAQSPYDVDYRVDSENLGQRGANVAGDFDRRKGHPDYQDDMVFSGEVDAWTSWDNKKEDKQKDSGRDRTIAGLMLVLVGLFFLLNQLDILSMREIFKYWPVLLIITGGVVLLGSFTTKNEEKGFAVGASNKSAQEASEPVFTDPPNSGPIEPSESGPIGPQDSQGEDRGPAHEEEDSEGEDSNKPEQL